MTAIIEGRETAELNRTGTSARFTRAKRIGEARRKAGLPLQFTGGTDSDDEMFSEIRSIERGDHVEFRRRERNAPLMARPSTSPATDLELIQATIADAKATLARLPDRKQTRRGHLRDAA